MPPIKLVELQLGGLLHIPFYLSQHVLGLLLLYCCSFLQVFPAVSCTSWQLLGLDGRCSTAAAAATRPAAAAF
jgi:hypothetical protein